MDSLNVAGEGDSTEIEGYFGYAPIGADTTTNGITSCFPDDLDETAEPFWSILVLAIEFERENCETIWEFADKRSSEESV